MRSFSIAALVGTVAATPATVFQPGSVPTFIVLTLGDEKKGKHHPPFKCTHRRGIMGMLVRRQLVLRRRGRSRIPHACTPRRLRRASNRRCGQLYPPAAR